MDILDTHDMHNMYLVMDNAKIHHNNRVIQVIQERGYKPVFLPPYSPFLNPIEEFWAKLKANIRPNPLSSNDRLTPKILEAGRRVSAQDCKSWSRSGKDVLKEKKDFKSTKSQIYNRYSLNVI